ncbi:hypothetical protein HUU05_04025 [candidate division KSB1 bacterium]|nr:hypothetical protein [candidate division KSB1 bacterium]
MKQNIFKAVGVLVPLLFLCACSSSPSLDPEKQPYKFEEAGAYPFDADTRLRDLDNDGRYEIIRRSNPPSLHWKTSIGSIQIRSQEDQVIEQVNFNGFVGDIRFVDYDSDGKLEIVVLFKRNDSLFASLLDRNGRKLGSFFLATGSPRLEPEGVIPWEPSLTGLYTADVDHDGAAELITVICTSLARAPRGVLIHSLPEGRLLGQYLVGAAIQKNFLGDFDGDGEFELVAGTGAFNNGASVNGYDDAHSYLLVFKLTLPPQIIWSEELGREWSGVELHAADFDGNSRQEFLVLKRTESSERETSWIEIMESGTWRTSRQVEFNEPLRNLALADLNRDGIPEILALRHPNEILVLDQQLAVRQRHRFVAPIFALAAVPDADGNGMPEIIARFETGFMLLDSDLKVKALALKDNFVSLMPSGIAAPPNFMVERAGKLFALQLVKNNFYLLNHYGPPALWIMGSALALGLMLGFLAMRRRALVTQSVEEILFASETLGLAMINSDGRLVRHNHSLFAFLESPQHALLGLHFTQTFTDQALCDFIARSLQSQPPLRHEFTLPTKQSVHVIIDPLIGAGRARPHWLLQFYGNAEARGFHQTQTWSLMAERVAHDLKSPLTSILLTLQRLQKEYRKHSPQHAQAYDEYAANIMERIEASRRLTRNFLKLFDIEKLHLVETDLNRFLQRAVNAINLPPDIQCELKPSAEPCSVPMDHEQMQVALENLVANAINAMPEGGKITLAVSLARNLHLPNANGNACDYAVLEVQDTGLGIPASAREHIFEPHFTTSENGTGLGLAMVKKIVAAHNGHVEFESEEGVGTVFSVYLPVV